MKASFIIGFHSARLDNLQQTLRFLSHNHGDFIHECQLVLVCQDECEPVFNDFGKYDHFNLNLDRMHLPHVTNFGVSRATADKLFILESDRILPAGYFEDVYNKLWYGKQITTTNMLKLARESTDEEIVRGKFDYTEEHRTDSGQLGMRNMWSGNTAIMRQDFIKVGTMDETYKGYGWADCDMTLAVEAAGIQSIFRPEIELHLWHPSMTYGDGDQKKMFIDNGLYFCKKWKQPLPDFLRKDIAEHRKVTLI